MVMEVRHIFDISWTLNPTTFKFIGNEVADFVRDHLANELK